MLNVSKKERKEFDLDLEHGDFGGLEFMIGGDDATPTNQKVIRVNGLVGKEYTFARAIRLDTYTRGRIFFINKRLYFIILITSTAEDLSSADAERFLNSFRLRKKKR